MSYKDSKSADALISHNNYYIKNLEATAGIRLSLTTGELEKGHPDRMTTLHFYKAEIGSKLKLLSKNYAYALATYSLDRNKTFIYTYSYQNEESWTTYNHDLTPESYGQMDYEFQQEVYFRINLKRLDGNIITELEADNINEIIAFTTYDKHYEEKQYFIDEIKQVAERVKKVRKEDSLVLTLLSDSHYTVNGTWEDTQYNISTLNQLVGYDGIVHLGDITDGMVSAAVTKDYVNIVVQGLLKNNVPLYITLGNHDSNYFRNNPERFTREQQYKLYLKEIQSCNNQDSLLYYYADYDSNKLRCIFLSSYDYDETTRYGFSMDEIVWLKEVLYATPQGYSVIVFSHVPPLARLHVWSNTIRNSDILMETLENYALIEGNRILAYIHGHNHADQIYRERLFPIISIGCAKCEYFTDKKPQGSFTYSRELNSVTQELWDIMVITTSEYRLDFIRFGAGEDRTLYY